MNDWRSKEKYPAKYDDDYDMLVLGDDDNVCLSLFKDSFPEGENPKQANFAGINFWYKYY